MEETVRHILSGSREGWGLLLDQYSGLLYNVFHSRSFAFSRQEVEDLFHDLLLNLLEDNCRRIRRFEGRNNCSFASYLKKIALNLAIDRKKKLLRARMASLDRSCGLSTEAREAPMGSFLDSKAHAPQEELISREEALLYLEALYRLPPHKLLVVLLIVYHDHDREKMARILKTTRQNIDVIFNRVKEQLRKILKGLAGLLEERPGEGCWSAPIMALRQAVLLDPRSLALDHCLERLSPPEELAVGILFLNGPALEPTPRRLALLLGREGPEVERFVEGCLEKIASASGEQELG